MNFKMKALVAAVAMTASMSASAAMTSNLSGDSSLILSLFDSTNQISATFDLGVSHTSFDRNNNFAWDVTGGDYADAWASFWSVAGANTTQWAVSSGDKLGSTAGSQSVFTTLVGAPLAVANNSLTNALGAFDTYIAGNAGLGNHTAVANGASVATSGNAYVPNYGYTGGGLYGNNLGDATGNMDSNISVWTFVTGPKVGLAYGTSPTVASQYATGLGFNPYFNLSSNGALTYTAAVAAVPEADSWAMLLAGLGLMGFIARRRTAA